MPGPKRRGFATSFSDRKLAEQHYRCWKCHKQFFSEWENIGKPQKHHIDGDKSNRGYENLALVCPRCHDILSRDQAFERQKHKVLKKQIPKKNEQKGFFDFGTPIFGASAPKKKSRKEQGFFDYGKPIFGNPKTKKKTSKQKGFFDW